MSDVIHVGTRKGLFTLERGNGRAGAGWRVARTAFTGEPVTMTLQSPRDGALFAAMKLGHFGVKLRRSRDGGATWEECAVPEYPDVETTDGKKPPSLHQIWALEAGGADEPAGALWAGTIPGGLFRSDDGGAS